MASRRAIECIAQLLNGGMPTRAEFMAAWEAGYLDITPDGTAALRDAEKGICENCGAYKAQNIEVTR